jgi:hypothetical protein
MVYLKPTSITYSHQIIAHMFFSLVLMRLLNEWKIAFLLSIFLPSHHFFCFGLSSIPYILLHPIEISNQLNFLSKYH